MIVDKRNESYHSSANHSYPKSRLIQKVIDSISSTPFSFKAALNKHQNFNLNEDELTLLFANQNQFQINKIGIPIRVGEQYRDLYHKTKGIPDLHYSILEEGLNYEPVFIMEAKRLPSPSVNREKEYVVGKTPSGNPNGGIERFKYQKHGKGLSYCGILGYVERGNFEDWLDKINSWILELMPTWSEQEKLKFLEKESIQVLLSSKVLREDSSELNLYHFWIDIFRKK
ncbi:hypothetical protein P8625_15135 [Tenacibaculum tangerinum]|uniref:Uncharacterized protein n=1 Tax=Tenacibaculum tangerinum TaxID=3038772 RepID=A0ABY8L1R1_9FLAO|nr:hypothetical protein [Tenacibaculum tangerinum]WGH75386.1 hypothetical protein P8625_15135 [Tenacibaculum tangerinum]